MKKCIYFLVALQATLITSAQKPVDVRVIRMNLISDKIFMQKKDPARLQLYAFYSNYFTKNNIYPNDDAIDLIDAYNKQITFEDVKTDSNRFKPLLLNSAVMRPRNRMFMMRIPVNTIANSLKIISDSFSQKQIVVSNMPDSIVLPAFKLKTQQFKNEVLPRINNNSANIPTQQIDYFITSLKNINRYMDTVASNNNVVVMTKVISELMDDFIYYDVKPVAKPQNEMRLHNTHISSGGNNVISFIAAYNDFSPPDDADLPNADIYVYTRDSAGNWDQHPKPDAFEVYYGANGLQFSLTPGCDTISLFTYHPSVPASVLPVGLPLGNVCFVLRDINTGKIYLRPDINLRDNKVIDDKQLIKLCFKVENQ